MLSQAELSQRRAQAGEMFARAGVYVTPAERDQIEIADFGLSDFAQLGLGVLVYVNTERCCAKELVLWPRQTCPEHTHPPVGDDPGKEETFRCRWGRVYLYVPGDPATNPQCRPPAERADRFTVWHEIQLNPGEQYTLAPNTPHWFQAGDEGAVVSEFSTRSTDENDLFTDPDIVRETKVAV